MAQDATQWLATMSKHCRQIGELAGVAIRDRAQYEVEPDKSTLRTALKGHFDAIQGALPEDFPSSRIYDLSRHIHFCQYGDWVDMITMDVPDVMAKAETYALAMPSNAVGEIADYIHVRFRPRLELALQAEQPDFHALILTCAVDLATHFKSKSEANDDSDAEIGRVFRHDNPVLIVPAALETDTQRNRQRGALQLMQGWRAFIRNPHAHEVLPADREYMVHALMLMSFLARMIDGATPAPPPEGATGLAE